MKKKIIFYCLALTLVMGMAGCNKKQDTDNDQETVKVEEKQETPTPTPDPTPTEEPLKIIGTEKEADTVYKVKLQNNTGKDITGVSIKLIEDTEFPENMLPVDDVYANGEKRYLYYDSAVQEQNETTGDENEKLLTPGYDIQITFSDGAISVLHAFPFGDIEEGEILFEDNVAFIKYINVSAGQEVSTKEAEITIKQNEEAAAQAQAEAEAAARAQAEAEAAAQAQAEAEAAARAQAEAEAAAQAQANKNNNKPSKNNNSSSGSQSNNGSQSSSGSENNSGSQNNSVPEAPEQDTEGCLGDDALTW